MTNPDRTSATDSLRYFPRIGIDFKIPLPWLLGIAFVFFWGCVNMFFSVSSLKEGMDELKVAVKASNSTLMQLTSEQALLKFRIEKLEASTTPHK